MVDEIKGLNKNATRMLTGLVFGTTVMLGVLEGKLLLLGILWVILFFAAKEYVQILNHKGFYPSLKMMYIANVVFGIIAFYKNFDLFAIALNLFAICAFMWVLFRGRQPYIANVATTLLGMVYCSWFPLHLLFLRNTGNMQLNDGFLYILVMALAIFLTDTGCYYIGRHFGKHKLSPVISPNKTVEGSIGGAVFGIAAALLFGISFGFQWYHALFIGIICTTFAQIGDLCESMLKRDAGVKDSGDILPGHGGFLDRCDSYILTIPVMYYYCNYFIVNTEWMNTVATFFAGLF